MKYRLTQCLVQSIIPLLFVMGSSGQVVADVAPADYRQKQSDKVWEENLRPGLFQERKIIEGAAQDVLELKAPYAAEDATVVPISIRTKVPQTAERFIAKIHVYVDKNPMPLVGLFEFTPHSGRADLAMRIRVDSFSYVRVIAEMNTGELYMTKSFVRAKGACSAPPPSSMEDSKRLLGKMKMNIIGDLVFGEPNLMQLKVRHPNLTGMAPLRIGSRVLPPAHFVNKLVVDYNGQMIMKATLTFSVSMDPAFRFFFVPEKEGVMTVRGTDTKKNEFSSTHEVSLTT